MEHSVHNMHKSALSFILNQEGKTSSEVAPPLVAFTFFQKLPSELQLMIWEFAMPPPRVIKLQVFIPATFYDPLYIAENSPYQKNILWDDFAIWQRQIQVCRNEVVFRADISPSGLSGVCRDSRDTLLKTHNVCIKLDGGKSIRVDGTNDTVVLWTKGDTRAPFLPGFRGGEETHVDYARIFAGIKRLGILGESWDNTCTDTGASLWLLSQFVSLEKLVFIAQYKEDEEVQESELVEYNLRDYDNTDALTIRSFERLMRKGAGIARMIRGRFEEHVKRHGLERKVPEVTIVKMYGCGG